MSADFPANPPPLAGAPISTRWNEQVKKQLVSSRLNATQLVVKAINGLPPQERPEVFVSSSAIGYYGTSESREFTENGPAGRDFLANLCQQARSRAWACAPHTRGMILLFSLSTSARPAHALPSSSASSVSRSQW